MKDDVIYRQDAIDAIKNCTDIYVTNLPVMIYKTDAYKALVDLPSVQPKQKGRWVDATKEIGWPIWKCSVCGGNGRGDYFVCPWCGADMREKEKWVPIQDPWKGEEDE